MTAGIDNVGILCMSIYRYIQYFLELWATKNLQNFPSNIYAIFN